MFGAVSRWFDARRKRREAVASAVRHFEASGQRRAMWGWCRVVGAEADDLVVRVCCWDDNIPPERIWYRVGSTGAVLGELSFEDAKQFGERAWR